MGEVVLSDELMTELFDVLEAVPSECWRLQETSSGYVVLVPSVGGEAYYVSLSLRVDADYPATSLRVGGVSVSCDAARLREFTERVKTRMTANAAEQEIQRVRAVIHELRGVVEKADSCELRAGDAVETGTPNCANCTYWEEPEFGLCRGWVYEIGTRERRDADETCSKWRSRWLRRLVVTKGSRRP